jgi:hypothetical protein
LRSVKEFLNWLNSNWERVVFAFAGLTFLAACLGLIVDEKITEAAILFGLSLLSFIYANVAKFKRFKGFGIEAELWENKQKEAANLIQQLRGLVATYSNELLMSKVKAGRWGPSNEWADRWSLYDELVGQHQQLGQQIDFSKTKKEMDDYFLFDMTMPEIEKLNKLLLRSLDAVSKSISQQFGSPITDSEGYGKRIQQRNDIWQRLEDPFETSKTDNLAQRLLDRLYEAQNKLKRDFDIELVIEQEHVSRLKEISALYLSRPIQITEKLVSWANKEP